MDLSALNPKVAANRAATVTLCYSGTMEVITDDKGSPLTFDVLGIGSEQWQAEELAIERENAEAEIKPEDKTSEQKAAELARKLAAVTVGWSDNIGLGKTKKLRHSKENALKLFQVEEWIAMQVLGSAMDRKERYFLDSAS